MIAKSCVCAGAGSLLGGVTRLTLAVTAIVVEMDQDIDLTIPVLMAIFVAKVSRHYTHFSHTV